MGIIEIGASGFKVEQLESIIAIVITASSLVEETRSFLIADTSRTCSNGGGGKNKCNNSTPKSVGRVCVLEGSIYHRCR